MSATDRPPRFLFAEVVRVAGTTGGETGTYEEQIDAQALVGREFVVQGAKPSA